MQYLFDEFLKLTNFLITMNQQLLDQKVEDFFEEDYDDSKELHDLIDGRLEASIICRDNKKIPNFLSVIYANKLFYLMFDID